jgi:glycosyltransferase involved in cell wall biosynthesis
MGISIAINLKQLYPGKIGGLETYIRNVLTHMLKIDTYNHYYLLLSIDNYHSFNDDNERIHKIFVSDRDDNYETIRKLKEYKVDVYYCPLLVLEPLNANIPSVVTIPDLQHEYIPEYFTKEILEWRQKYYQLSAEMADAIITLSLFSKNSIIEKLKIEENKVFSIHLAADEIYDSKNIDKEQLSYIKNKYKLPSNYGYYPANTWPHKNHDNLIEALKRYKDNYGEPPHIVLTGYNPSSLNILKNKIHNYALDRYITYLGYVDKSEMPYLYGNASFLIFPSLFEGFGIPILEAMRMECPVLCSNNTSIPEVAEDAAIYFDPYSPDDIAKKMNQLITDQGLKRAMVEKGIEQSKKYSWDKAAQETLDLFYSVAKLSPKERSNKYPLVSIITPSYNQGEFIEEAIVSVLNQDYPNLEYIIMDGGSTDNTLEILKKYEDDKRMTWISEKDNGQADAVNKGFTLAKGKIFGWLNSDDLFLPGSISKAVEHLLINPHSVLVYGNAYWIDKEGKIISSYPTEPFNYKRFSETCFICQPTVFLRKELINEIGLLDVSLNTCLDYDYWIRIAKVYPKQIGYISDYMASSRMYNENKTLSLREEVYREIMATVKKHYGYISESWIHGYIKEIIINKNMSKHRNKPRYVRALLFLYYIMCSKSFTFYGYYSMLVKRLKKRKNRFNGIYEDDWVSKCCIIELVNNSTFNNIKINGLHCWPLKKTLVLNISIEKQTKKIIIKDRGEFTIDLPIADIYKQQEKLKLIIETNKTFIPKRYKINEDGRSLSFILKKAELC